MTAVSQAKRAMRKKVAAALSSLPKQTAAAQSVAVITHLAMIPAYLQSRCASIYLPIDGGCEVDTWSVVADLLDRGIQVSVPRVTGPAPSDMQMLRIDSLEQAKALPRNKWGIPEPDDGMAAHMEDMTFSEEFDLLLVPGVAFDARCNRLGHGRGYYDSFISEVRARRDKVGAGPNVTVIGLSLEPQLVDQVPVSEYDERLDLVIHPTGRFAYAPRGQQRAVANLQVSECLDDGEEVNDTEESPPKRTRGEADDGAALAARAMAEGLDVVELTAGRCELVVIIACYCYCALPLLTTTVESPQAQICLLACEPRF